MEEPEKRKEEIPFLFLSRIFLLLKKEKKKNNIILGAANVTGGYAQTNCHFWAF